MYEVKPFDPEKWIKQDNSFQVAINTQDDVCFNKVGPWEVKAIPYRYFDKDKHYWGQLKFVIKHNGEDYMTLYRNYSTPATSAYICQNDKEYLITSLDYQCISIINLTNKTYESYCLGDHDKGWGFCPYEFYAEEDDGIVTLEVTGCYWGGPEEHFKVEIEDLDKFEFPENVEMWSDYDDETEQEEDE